MTHRQSFTLSLTLRSPFVMQGLAADVFGIDAAALRDAEGIPIVPADQVKGLMRAACESLAAAGALLTTPEIALLFGSESDSAAAEQDAPQRGALIFADLAAPAAFAACKTKHRRSITRVAIEADTGAAKPGALVSIELVAAPGEDVVFSGGITARAEPALLARLTTILDRAAKLIPFAGAMRSAGFGEVVRAQTEAHGKPEPLALPQAQADTRDSRCYRIQFDRPILVDAARSENNVFEGAAIVPGAALKGALARRLALAGANPEDAGSAIGAALSKIRFSHAFPAAENGEAPLGCIPLSLAASQAERPTIADLLLADSGQVLLDGLAPLYAPEWKPGLRDTALPAAGLQRSEDPDHLPRGHARIGEGYVAQDAHLYVTIDRSHLRRRADGCFEKREWLATVSRNDADPALFAQLCAALEQGLDGVGATGARAEFLIDDRASARTPKCIDGQKRLWAVMLRTPALLVDPRDAHGMSAEAQYRAYWNERGAAMVRFFASQRLAGGHIAVRRRLYGANTYYPFVLTEPGSVFLLEGDLERPLEALLATGLPLPKTLGHANWRNCPYLRENGYGEIVVNAIGHHALQAGVRP